jgi:hypothetical protein
MHGLRLVWYAVVVCAVFAVADLLTRSPILIGDSQSYIEIARAGNAGEIHYGGPILSNPLSYPMGGGPVHHFRPPGARIDMAMTAGLIAFAADIDLQRLEPRALQGHAMLG